MDGDFLPAVSNAPTHNISDQLLAVGAHFFVGERLYGVIAFQERAVVEMLIIASVTWIDTLVNDQVRFLSRTRVHFLIHQHLLWRLNIRILGFNIVLRGQG